MSENTVEVIFETVADTASGIREGLVWLKRVSGRGNQSNEDRLAADLHTNQLLTERLLAIESDEFHGQIPVHVVNSVLIK